MSKAHIGEFLNSPLWVKTKYFNEKEREREMMGVKRAEYQETKRKKNTTSQQQKTNKKNNNTKNQKEKYVHDQHSLVPLAFSSFIDFHSPSHTPNFDLDGRSTQVMCGMFDSPSHSLTNTYTFCSVERLQSKRCCVEVETVAPPFRVFLKFLFFLLDSAQKKSAANSFC